MSGTIYEMSVKDMKLCRNEHLLSAFALERLADPQMREAVSAHLRHCALCRDFVDERRILEAFFKEPPSGRVDRLAARVMASIKTEPSDAALIFSPLAQCCEAPSVFRLAADDARPVGSSVLESYANEERDIVLRLMHDLQHNVYSLHLVGKDVSAYKDAMLAIPGSEKRYLFDERGQIRLEKDMAELVKSRRLTLRSSTFSFDIDPMPEEIETALFNGEYALRHPKYGRIDIRISDRSEKRVYTFHFQALKESGQLQIAVTQRGAQPVFADVHEGVAVIEPVDSGEPLEVHIY